MGADYTPTLGNYTELKPFRYWCQKVLPLVYDDSLSYYELLCKIVDYLNKTMEDVDTLHDDVDNLHDAYVQLQAYVNNYFESLDITTEINNKLDAMAESGELTTLIEPFIPDLVSEWLDKNISPTTPAIDASLTVEGAGADALITGENFTSNDDDLMLLTDRMLSLTNNSIPQVWFERGSISSGTNDSYRSKSRVRTKAIINLNANCYISVSSGKYLVAYYNIDNTWSRNTGWIDTPTYIPKDQKFRLVVSPDPAAADIVRYSISEMLEPVSIQSDLLETNVLNQFSIHFEHGALNQGADDNYNRANRIRSNILCFPFGVIFNTTNYYFTLHMLNFKGEFTNSYAWRNQQSVYVRPFQMFRLGLCGAPTASTFMSLDTLVNDLSIEYVPAVNNNDANIIFQCRNVDDVNIPSESKWYIKQAANNQYDRVRFTVRKTTDGYYFNCHDDYINNVARNPDGSRISRQIAANGQSLATLNSYDWGIKYGSIYAGATVPLLEDSLKYASAYNLGVTYHSATSAIETDEDIAAICTLFDTYGLTDKMIVISANRNVTTLAKFVAHNPRISVYMGNTEEWFEDSDNINALKALQTEFNHIYVQLYPWGSTPTEDFIQLAKTNNFCLYDSVTMSQDDFLNESTFNKGYTLMEVNNVYMIKDTLRNWANSQIQYPTGETGATGTT